MFYQAILCHDIAEQTAITNVFGYLQVVLKKQFVYMKTVVNVVSKNVASFVLCMVA